MRDRLECWRLVSARTRLHYLSPYDPHSRRFQFDDTLCGEPDRRVVSFWRRTDLGQSPPKLRNQPPLLGSLMALPVRFPASVITRQASRTKNLLVQHLDLPLVLQLTRLFVHLSQ